MTCLALLASLAHGGDSGRALNLVRRLRRASPDVRIEVAVLGRDGPVRAELASAGASVHCFAWTRAMDPTPPWLFRQSLMETGAEEVHVFGLAMLRALALVRPGLIKHAVVHRLLPDVAGCTRLDRALLERVRELRVDTQWEAWALSRRGFSPRRIAHTAPLARLHENAPAERPPSGRRGVVAVARLEHRHNPRDAVWTMDILAYAFPDLWLDLVGTGQLRSSLVALEARVHYAGRTRFLGALADVTANLRAAQACWITARPGHGLLTALEAQAAGCPIIAYDQPALRELVPGARFVPPGDMVGLARQTHALLACGS